MTRLSCLQSTVSRFHHLRLILLFNIVQTQFFPRAPGKGFGKMCPRDDRVNCSFVDALEQPCRAKATHFVSWCWRYTLDDVVDAIHTWLQEPSTIVASEVYLWMCFFCNNQYRVLEEKSTTGSAELQSVFENNLARAGQMLVILDSFLEPYYFSRAWCLFETFVCINRRYPRAILLPSRQLEDFRVLMETQGPAPIREKIQSIDLQRAEATVKADEDAIKRVILETCGFATVNNVVQQEILNWILDAFRKYLSGH